MNCYNIWEHFYTKDSLVAEMQVAEFHECELYGNIAGAKLSDTGETLCGVFTK